jgi:XTP/dITP diphosphohydrolase
VIERAPAWVLATSNRGKLRELQELLADTGLELRRQDELGVTPAAETAATFVENALLKARHASLKTRLPAIADDSGLAVHALDGAPGVHSARFAGPGCSDRDNVRRLLTLLDGVPEARRTARFHCVVVALRGPADPAPLIASGTWSGRIAATPAGAGGFGYDPVFIGDALAATAAELSPRDKRAVSHRGQALRALRPLLLSLLGARSA